MVDHRHYVPILKGKMGEYGALQEITLMDRVRLTPLIEVSPIPWDYQNDAPSKTPHEHVAPVAANIHRGWGGDAPAFVDAGEVDDIVPADGRHPLGIIMENARERELRLIPVISSGRTSAYIEAAACAVRDDRRGVCLRATDDDLGGAGLDAFTSGVMTRVGVTRADVDLIIDLGELLGGNPHRDLLAARSILALVPHAAEWRSLILTGAAFPQNLSGFATNSVGTTPRSEWAIWRALAAPDSGLPRLPTFSDYGISHPETPDMDTRVMKMSVNLRYTASNDWLIFKGRDAKRYGHEQFREMCRQLQARPEYAGPSFSWGDNYIADCARGDVGPGNATTWRKVGTSHHLAHVVNQIASLGVA